MILLTIKAVKTFLNYYVSKKTFFEKSSLTLGKGLKVTHIFFMKNTVMYWDAKLLALS